MFCDKLFAAEVVLKNFKLIHLVGKSRLSNLEKMLKDS